MAAVRFGGAQAVKNVALLLGSTFAAMVLCELGWRTYLRSSGRGFFR